MQILILPCKSNLGSGKHKRARVWPTLHKATATVSDLTGLLLLERVPLQIRRAKTWSSLAWWWTTSRVESTARERPKLVQICHERSADLTPTAMIALGAVS